MKKIAIVLTLLSLTGCAIGFRGDYEAFSHRAYQLHRGPYNVYYYGDRIVYVWRDGYTLTFYRAD